MPLEVIAPSSPLWADLARRADADIFYEPGYAENSLQAQPVMLLYRGEHGLVFDVTLRKDVSSLPFVADSRHRFPSPLADLASPEYNSPLILGEPSDAAELLRGYRAAVDEYCRDTNVVTEFVRFHPLSRSALLAESLPPLVTGSEMVHVDLRDGYEAALRGYRKGHRSTVRKAEREGAGFRIRSSGDSEAIDTLFALYSLTMEHKSAKSVYHMPRSRFSELTERLGDRALLMEALWNGEVASSNLFVLGRKHIWFRYSGLEPRHRQSGAHTYMMDRAIHWAWEHGFEHFMLGAGIEPGDSTHAFKRGFSHLSAPVRHIRKVHSPAILALLSEAKAEYDARRGRETRTDYFPGYWLD